jgi:alpha-L-arabinofuranosidase
VRFLGAMLCCLAGLLTASDTSQSVDVPPKNAAREAVIRVDIASDLGRVNKRVLGNNALAYLHSDAIYSAGGSGMWDPKAGHGVPDMVRLARDCGVSTLRWPGGCGVHEYNWKLTVGHLKERPQQPFGLPEFLRLAEEIGADPVITLADFWGDPSDAADLVEYLNAPVGKNPNGGVDWAAVRTRDGHPQPYNVVWFECGNETYHGAHSGATWKVSAAKRYSIDEYAQRYRGFRTAMRVVDPRIRLGAVLHNDKNPFSFSPWTEGVIRKTGDIADFYIHHAYLPNYADDSGSLSPAELFKSALASPRQFALYYERLNAFIQKATGRSVPLAVTEYNGGFVQDKPVPYRLTLGAAVEVADLVQVLLDPGHGIEIGQYWQFANEYWGMVKGVRSPYTLRPAYHVFRLYHDHLGDRLLRTEVRSDTFETTGGFGVLAARGSGIEEFSLIGKPAVLTNWQISGVRGAAATVEKDGTLAVELSTDRELNYFHAKMPLSAEPSSGYRVTAEIRSEGMSMRGAQLEVADGRGWRATKSAALSEMVRESRWTEVSVDYVSLPDTREIRIAARRLEGAPERGRFWIRNVRVQRFNPGRMGNVPFVGAMATVKGGRVAVFAVNRRLDGPVAVRIDGTRAGYARGWTLSGPSVDATNESNPNTVRVQTIPVEVRDRAVWAQLPPNSFTVLDVDPLPASNKK